MQKGTNDQKTALVEDKRSHKSKQVRLFEEGKRNQITKKEPHFIPPKDKQKVKLKSLIKHENKFKKHEKNKFQKRMRGLHSRIKRMKRKTSQSPKKNINKN